MSFPRPRRVYFRQEETPLPEGAQVVAEHIEVEDHDPVLDEEAHEEETKRGNVLEHNSQPWSSMASAKRPYPEDDTDDDLIPNYSAGYQRSIPDGPRRRGRPKKFPSGTIPPHYLNRMQQAVKQEEPVMQELDYEEESQIAPLQPQGARVVSMTPRLEQRNFARSSSSLVSAPRLSQPGPLRIPQSIGQATHIASQRLPTISGAPPKENKPLKVVTLLPNSRRQGGGPSRPLVSSVRQLGSHHQTNKIPQMSIEKQAELIINRDIKLGDKIVNGATVGEFNKVVESLNKQVQGLQEDNKKLNNMFLDLVDFKDNRIKQLENQVERLQTELSVAVKHWQTQLVLAEQAEPKEEKHPQNIHRVISQASHEAFQLHPISRVAQLRTHSGWIIEDEQAVDNGEIHEEIIEEVVDVETFMRMQEAGFIHPDVEEVNEEVAEEVINADEMSSNPDN